MPGASRPEAPLARRRIAALLAAFALLGCAPEARREEPNPLDRPPVDSLRAKGSETWRYREEAAADLDGDGAPETLVLAADVTPGADGRPLWEDGHRWALFVESPRNERTMLYAAFVPNGRAMAAILQPDDRGRRRVLVEERTATQLNVYEIEYAAPGRARLSSGAFSRVERWLESPAR